MGTFVMCINARDYLFLVSGATIPELEEFYEKKGTFRNEEILRTLAEKCSVRDLFFFDRSDSFFGEVLYLKLSFIKEILAYLFRREDLLLRPDFVSTFERISIDMDDMPRIVPLLWNFRIGEIGSEPGAGIHSETVPLKRRLFRSALVLFYSLLVNKEQDMAEIDKAFRDACGKENSGGDTIHADFPGNLTSISLLPENIFWDPGGRTVPPGWTSLWDKTLMAGWSLLKENIDSRENQAQEVFSRRLDSISEEARSLLFHDRGMESDGTEEADREDIRAILARIGRKWEREAGEGTGLADITTRSSDREGPFSHSPSQTKEPDLTLETVLLSSRKASGEIPIPPSRTPAGAPDLVETVIMSSDRKKGESGKGDKSQEIRNDFLAETVILKTPPGKGKDGAKK